jgi:hypothetical protein
MTLPGDLTTRAVTGTFQDISGALLTGQVTLAPAELVADSTGKVIVAPFGRTYPLTAGTFTSDELVTTDNADLSPANWQYVITVALTGGTPYSWSAPLPSGAGTLDLSAMVPVVAGSLPEITLPLGVGLGGTGATTVNGALAALGISPLPGGTTDYLRADGTWDVPPGGGLSLPAGDLGGTSGAPVVRSVNGVVTSGEYARGNGAALAMSAILAADLPTATAGAKGAIQLGGGTVNYLRADGTWDAPPGGSTTLAGDTDTAISSPATGQGLVWNGTKWANAAGLESSYAIGSPGASHALDVTAGAVQTVTLTANMTYSWATAPGSGAWSFTLIQTQNSSGPWTVTWPASPVPKWQDGTPAAPTANPNAVDVFVFFTPDGGTTWFGSMAGANFS